MCRIRKERTVLPSAMKEGVDWAEEGEERYQPCCYNTVTGKETVLMRSRGFNCSVYAVNVTSDYLLVSYSDDPDCDGSSMKIEKLSDPFVVYDASGLVRGAEAADAFVRQEAEEKAAREEEIRNEPYGPGSSNLYLSAPNDRWACFRLVRMDGSSEFMVLLSPGEETKRSFPCGRYTLKTAEGDTWISDEEAFGKAGSCSTTDVFTFEAGGSYEIRGGYRGDFYSDDAGGFTAIQIRKIYTGGNGMKLRDTADVWFSELDDNWEECGFYWVSMDRRKDERYRRYGDLPDGRHFGAGFVPAFGDPWGRESAVLIVGEDGELQQDTPSWIEKRNSWPLAMASSPDGRCLVWLTADKQLGVWTRGKEGFTIWDGKNLTQRLDGRTILDVKMKGDGLLEIECRGGENAGYLYGADLLLAQWKGGWTPRARECRNLSFALKNGLLHTCPDWLFVRICEDDCWGEYAGCGVKKVLFDQGLERIEGEILSGNPDLETAVIPASVRQVDWHAFGGCTGLKNLVIEGNLSRVANWDKDAFEGCPCEEYYSRIYRREFRAALEQCTDDAVLYGIVCSSGPDPDMVPVREKAARMIRDRDYRYALSSHLRIPERTAMILNLYDSLEGDELFIARTILTDPDERNKAHMLLYCQDENLLMLGWKYVYGARKICAERLHAIGSIFPEAYREMDPQERWEWEQIWLLCAGETALALIPEDEAVGSRISGAASVDSDPLHFYLSMQHPRKAVRERHAGKLKDPASIAYAGRWTSDERIRKEMSVRISSTGLITEMLFGNLSAADPVFGFRRPEDLTLQDLFCIEIMKNHPDRRIREHVRTELLRSHAVIPGADLTKPDPFYHK